MARIVSPTRSPDASPAAKTSATTVGPESYIVRQPKSGLFCHLMRLPAYKAYSARTSSSARVKAVHWKRRPESALERFISGSRSRKGPVLPKHGDQDDG